MTSNIIYCTMLCTLLFSSCKRQEIVNEKVIAPFIETIVFQSFLVPVIYFWVRKISIKSNERRFRQFICLLSAIIFSLVHSFNHTYYPVVIFPFCYLLNFVFVDTYFKEGKVRAFQLTWLIHLFWNLIILIGFYTSEYFM